MARLMPQHCHIVLSVVGDVNRTGPAALGAKKQEANAMSIPNIPQLLVHDHKDNVGVVVVEGLKAGTDMLCVVTADNSTFRMKTVADVPIGHKIALKDLKAGDTAVKYGEDIGKIVQSVAAGSHVHVHNLKTKRW
jgi:(2R)-sulfolactate sulfo-lyase subunit alpha